VRGDKEDSINGQSTYLDIEIRDVVQKPLLPLNGMRCTIFPLTPGLGFLDMEIRCKKVKGGLIQVARVCDDDLLTDWWRSSRGRVKG